MVGRSLTFLAFAALAIAVPQLSPHVLHETHALIPSSWTQTRRLEADAILPMRFGLTQNNIDRLEEELMAVSHPESERYGQHWTPEEIAGFFAPSRDTIEAVRDWLHDSGISMDRQRLSKSKGWIKFNATVAEVEDLLKTEYHVWTDHDGAERVGCHLYHLPAHMQEHVDLVKPTVHMEARISAPTRNTKRDRIGKRHAAPTSGLKTNGKQPVPPKGTTTLGLADCDEFITPICLQTLYNIDYTPVETHVNTFGIVEFTPQAFLQGDLNLFFKNFTPARDGTKPVLVSIDGGVAQTTDQSFDFNGESDLDLEYGFALTTPQPILLLQTGDLVEGAGFDNWLDAVDAPFCTFEGGDDPTQDGIYPDPLPGGFDHPESCGIIPPPKTVSISYAQDEVTITAKSATRQCNEYGKLGLGGTSIFYASGDDGVAGFDGCLLANGTESVNGTRFNPEFPATCPFVTAVGATQVNPGSTVNDPEGAAEQVIFSGGGFSNIFSRPSYQVNVVETFLKDHPPPFTSKQFNTSFSRGFPDVAANGVNFVIAIDGEFELVFGTSAATPTFASIITLINDARISKGKSTVGFINPTVYTPQFIAAFNDITSGGNQGCGTAGFTATKGWDPVTGLGTPNFKKLLDLWLSLP